MEFVVIEKKEWELLNETLIKIEQNIAKLEISQPFPQTREWMPLIEFLKHSTISRASWYREYQYKIKFRNDGIKIWVHWPSYENYLEEKAINKKAA
ncbi:MAG TPA: hypothetical protein VN026_08170 [Bacteroidia bacterium]|jgi:hypothetical protein|nr:hypothetical protein [Bacteroidia bacterium]